VELATNVAQELGRDKGLVTVIDRNEKIMTTSTSFNRNVAERSATPSFFHHPNHVLKYAMICFLGLFLCKALH
jgi:hypothetical protein